MTSNHTNKEWEDLKEKHKYCCALCGVPENHLETLYKGTFYEKLTKDHKIPISKGGVDKIENIQPACVSCNSQKRNNIEQSIICVSGGFDCVHVGHVRMLQEAAMYGRIIVILNSDEWLLRKKGYTFHKKWEDRANIMYAFNNVIGVSYVDDNDGSVCEALKRIKPNYYANGGDRLPDNTPEVQVCSDLGIKMLWNVGGDKIESSSNLVSKATLRHGR